MKIAISEIGWDDSELDDECKRRNHLKQAGAAGCVGGEQSVYRPIRMV